MVLECAPFPEWEGTAWAGRISVCAWDPLQSNPSISYCSVVSVVCAIHSAAISRDF